MKKTKVLLVYPNLMLVSTLPNNIAILSASIKKAGHDVRLFDATLYHTSEKSNDDMRVERMQVRPFNFGDKGVSLNEADINEDFKKAIREYSPDLVAVTVVDDTVNMGCKLIENAFSSAVSRPAVIFGGVHAMFNAETLIKHSFIDMVCVGEGEHAISELCDAIAVGKSLETVPNIWFKTSKGGVKKNKCEKLLNVNELPFEDFSIFEDQRFYRPMQGRIVKTIPINFDRGCPYNCTFCCAPQINRTQKILTGGKYFRMKSVKRIHDEFKFQLENYKIEYLYFNSETFLSMTLQQLMEFAKMYERYSLPFWCQTRIETVTEDKIKILKEMNCDRVSVGIEHGNENFRRSMLKKMFSNSDVIKAFDVFRKYDIKVSVNNVIGFPEETRELIFDTIKLNREIRADSINGFIFQPYTGTELRDYCIKRGYLKDSSCFDFNGTPIGDPVLEMPQISNEELKGLLRTFVLYVKMPESYYPEIKEAERLDSIGDETLSRLREIFFSSYF